MNKEELKKLFDEKRARRETHYQELGCDSLLKILNALQYEIKESQEPADLFRIGLHLSYDSTKASYQFEEFMTIFLELFPENKLLSYYFCSQLYLVIKDNEKAYIQIVKEN